MNTFFAFIGFIVCGYIAIKLIDFFVKPLLTKTGIEIDRSFQLPKGIRKYGYYINANKDVSELLIFGKNYAACFTFIKPLNVEGRKILNRISTEIQKDDYPLHEAEENSGIYSPYRISEQNVIISYSMQTELFNIMNGLEIQDGYRLNYNCRLSDTDLVVEHFVTDNFNREIYKQPGSIRYKHSTVIFS